VQTTASESLYRRLQQHLDRMPVGFPATRSGVEIRILERLFTPELEPNEKPGIPPDDTKALYIQMLQDRYGPWGMAKIGVRKMLGLKI